MSTVESKEKPEKESEQHPAQPQAPDPAQGPARDPAPDPAPGPVQGPVPGPVPDPAQPPKQKSILDWPWPVIVSIFGVVALGIAYSLGDAYYGAYLRRFWIEPSAFPIDKSRHLLLSLFGALTTVSNVQFWVGLHKIHIVKSVGVILISIAAWVVIESGLRWVVDHTAKRAGGKIKSIKPWPIVLRFSTIVFWLWIVVGIGWALGMSVPTFMAIPSVIGESAGDGVAVEQMHDFDRGCWVSEARCQKVIKSGKEVARGYIVAQSSTHIALYYEGNTIQLPLDGSELKTVERPNFDQMIPR